MSNRKIDTEQSNGWRKLIRKFRFLRKNRFSKNSRKNRQKKQIVNAQDSFHSSQKDGVTTRSVKPQLKQCQHSDCSYQTNYAADLKTHEMRHLGIKPYKCKWPQCDYASTERSNTIRHIREKHFNANLKATVRLDDYVEVNEMLLGNHNEDDVGAREEESEVGHDKNGEKVEDNQKDDITSGPLKPPRLSRLTTSSSTKQKQIITYILPCPRCGLMYVKYKLNKHSIGPSQCLVKDCGQSFGNKKDLTHHLAQSHQFTTQWHCAKCDHNFPSYQQLSIHNVGHHQLGHFHCTFPSCTFTGEFRVSNHYARQHKQTLKEC